MYRWHKCESSIRGFSVEVWNDALLKEPSPTVKDGLQSDVMPSFFVLSLVHSDDSSRFVTLLLTCLFGCKSTYCSHVLELLLERLAALTVQRSFVGG